MAPRSAAETGVFTPLEIGRRLVEGLVLHETRRLSNLHNFVRSRKASNSVAAAGHAHRLIDVLVVALSSLCPLCARKPSVSFASLDKPNPRRHHRKVASMGAGSENIYKDDKDAKAGVRYGKLILCLPEQALRHARAHEGGRWRGV